MSLIQVKRGKKAGMPRLHEGEFGYCTDTNELYIGTGGRNQFLCSAGFDVEMDEIRQTMAQALAQITDLQNDSTAMEQTVSALLTLVSSQGEKIDSAHMEIEDIKQGAALIGEKVTALEDGLDSMNEEVSENGASIGLLQSGLTLIGNDLAGVQTGLSSLAQVARTGSFDDLTNRPSALPANGGNAQTVNGHTVQSDVPLNAVFTDTVITKVSEIQNDAGYLSLSSIEAGENITIDKTGGKVTIASVGGTDAQTVNGHTVQSDVPANAVFTDTVITKVSEIQNDAGYLTPSNLEAGENITIDKSGGKVTIASVGGTDAQTVNGHTVQSDVPANAVFTDTVITKVSEIQNDAGYLTPSNLEAGENITIDKSGGKVTIASVGGSGAAPEVIDDVTSTRTDAALSANMGRELSIQVNGKLDTAAFERSDCTGVLQLSNGLLMQWGSAFVTCVQNEVSILRVTFTKRFKSVPVIVLTAQDGDPGTRLAEVSFQNANAKLFQACVYKTVGGITEVQWFAIGDV